MNPKKFLRLLTCVSFALGGLLAVSVARAQTAATGTIEGRVLNVTTSR